MKHTQRSFVFVAFIAMFIGGALSPLTHVLASSPLSSDTIRPMVEKYFKDAPDMVKVAQCESGFRQFDESGNVLRGGSDDDMIGLYQIDETVHRDTAASMGYDIDTLIGNLLYTRYLYTQEGVNPWIGCVGNDLPVISTIATAQKEITPPYTTTTTTSSTANATDTTDTTFTVASTGTVSSTAYVDTEDKFREAVFAYLQKLLAERKKSRS